jgi:uncharacterized Zn-finger protein
MPWMVKMEVDMRQELEDGVVDPPAEIGKTEKTEEIEHISIKEENIKETPVEQKDPLYLTNNKIQIKNVEEIFLNKRFKCSECDKTICSKGGLDYHIKSKHLMIRPFECNECYKTYPQQAALKWHKKSCRKKKFPCSQCDLAFSDPASLVIHKKLLHRQMLICSVLGCGAKFAFKNAMKNHEKAIHGYK